MRVLHSGPHTHFSMRHPFFLFQNGKVVTDALRQTTFDRGVARELVLVLTASDNMATYRCDAKNEAKKTVSAHTKLKVLCESDWTSNKA